MRRSFGQLFEEFEIYRQLWNLKGQLYDIIISFISYGVLCICFLIWPYANPPDIINFSISALITLIISSELWKLNCSILTPPNRFHITLSHLSYIILGKKTIFLTRRRILSNFCFSRILSMRHWFNIRDNFLGNGLNVWIEVFPSAVILFETYRKVDFSEFVLFLVCPLLTFNDKFFLEFSLLLVFSYLEE